MTETGSELRTFLIADVRGYTRFTHDYGDEAAARLAARFADIAQEVVTARGGHVVELRGDEVLATFTSARQALRAALDLQRHAADEHERDGSLPLEIGIGLDAGEAIPIKGGYRGGALNLAARLCGLAGPGEVLASQGVTHLAGKLDEVAYLERAAAQLKGYSEPVIPVQIVLQAVPAEAAAPRVTDGETSDRWPLDDKNLPVGGFLGALPVGPLVARAEELRQVLAAVDEVVAGSGRLVLLAGEPGVGKTRLAQEVTRVARDRGFILATGRCYEPHQGVPFYPFLEALSVVYEAVPPSVQDRVISRWPHVARLLPDEIEGPATLPGDPQEEQRRLFRSVTGFLQLVAEVKPVALLLDDLHWADGSSLALLQQLARDTRGEGILLLGTYRDVEVNPDHPLERVLLDLGRERLLQRVRLRRLAENETAEMMVATLGHADLSAELVDLVHSRTDGNPFFVEEVIRALVEQGDLHREDGRWVRRVAVTTHHGGATDLEVPESVRSVIGQRLGRLSDITQEVLLEASIFGPVFTFDNLGYVSTRSEGELEAVVEEATAAGLLQEIDRDAYAFNHALTQQALYARLSSRRRRRLHLTAGEALEESQNTPRRRPTSRAAELAWHFLEGDDPERALLYSLAAGSEAQAVSAHAEAERHYRTALDLAREQREPRAEAEALELLGTVYFTISRYDEAIEMQLAAARLNRELGDRTGEARLGVQLGWTYRGKGASDEGVQVVESLLDRLQSDVSPQDLAELFIVLEILHFATGRYAEGAVAAERAAELAHAAGNVKTLVRAEVSRGSSLSMLGRNEEARTVLEDVLPQANLIEDDARTHGRLLINLANVYWRQGRVRKAREIIVQALNFTEQTGNQWGIAFCLSNLGSVDRVIGEWARAQLALDRAVALSRAAGATWWFPYPLLEFGWLLTDRGDWDAARSVLTEAADLGRINQDVQVLRASAKCLAHMDLAVERPRDAIVRLEPLLDRPGLEEVQVSEFLPVLAASYLGVGDTTRAESVIADAVRRAESDEQRAVMAEALLVRGRIMSALGRRRDAKHDLDEAAMVARDMPWPLLEARSLLELGLLATQHNDLAEAHRRVEAALAIAGRLGAKPEIKRAQEMLSKWAASDGGGLDG